MSALKRERRPATITPKEARLVLDLMERGFLVGDLVTPGKLFPAPSVDGQERREALRSVANKYNGYLTLYERRQSGQTIRLTGAMFRAAQEWQGQNAQTVQP